MANKKFNFQPSQLPKRRHQITGIANFAAVRGMVVVQKNGADHELELATGRAGYFLRRDVLATGSIDARRDTDAVWKEMDDFQSPYQQGGAALAEDYEGVWVEGPAILDASMDATIAVDQAVTTAAGKIAKLATSEAGETLGIVRKIEAAKNHAGPAKRFFIQIVRSPKVVPAP